MENFFLVFAVKKKDLNVKGALYNIELYACSTTVM